MKKCIIELLKTNVFQDDKHESLSNYVGKNVVMYDEHHGSAILLKNASLKRLQEIYDEYTVVITLP